MEGLLWKKEKGVCTSDIVRDIYMGIGLLKLRMVAMMDALMGRFFILPIGLL
jgi:hypothetical protein